MAVLFVDGFTGSPNIAPNNWSTNTLRSLGYTLNALYGGSNASIPDDGNIVINVEADPVFPTRSQVCLRKGVTSSTTTLVEQMTMPLPDATSYNKIVLGMTMMATSTNASSAFFATIGGTVQYTSSTGGFPGADTLVQFYFQPGDVCTAYFTQAGTNVTIPIIKRGQFNHVEFLIEKDVSRIRMYIDGVLYGDYNYTMNFNGFNLAMLITTGHTGITDVKYSNVYCLGLDTVHTAKLGPGARVLELPPQADANVAWDRPANYASNASVLQQYYSKTGPDYLTTGVPATDLYAGPDAVANNAALVYGMAMKVQAMTMADGTHTLTAASQHDSVDGQSSKTATLTLASLKSYVFDLSVNPSTGAKWTPQEVAASKIGIKLLS